MSEAANGPLEGIRVLDLSDERGAYCTKLLVDFGAEVVKVEPPEGDRLRRKPPFKNDLPHPDGSLSFAYYHANKRSVTLDLARRTDRALLKKLIADVDVLVESFQADEASAYGLRYELLRRSNPGLVHCSITPFGKTGPYRGLRATHFTTHAMGGLMFAQGEPGGPPIAIPGNQAYDMAGAHAALCILVALRNRHAVGGQFIDLSVHEMLGGQMNNLYRYGVAGIIQPREGRSFRLPPAGTWQCRDGYIQLSVVNPNHWTGFLDLFGRPEELSDPKLNDRIYRTLHNDELQALLPKYFAGESKHDLVERAQGFHIPATPWNTPAEYINDAQIQARGFFVEVTHPYLGRYESPGAPFKLSEPLWSFRRPAPGLGEHNQEVLGRLQRSEATGHDARRSGRDRMNGAGDLSIKRLDNVRVLSFCQALAGNACATYLAELGAEVIKIESRTRPDSGRPRLFADHPPVFEKTTGAEVNAGFGSIVRSQKGITIDMAKPEGRELFKRLLATSDIVMENFGVNVMTNWGMDYPELRKVKPDIIMLSMPGLGKTGPKREYITYGANISAFTGLAHLWGYTHGTLNDYISAAHGAFGLLAALAHRDRTGRGLFIDLAQSETGGAVMGPLYLDYTVNHRDGQPLGNRVLGSAYSGVFRCKGADRWLAVELETEEDWRSFCAVLGRTDLLEDPRFATPDARWENQKELDQAIERWSQAYTPHQAMLLLEKAGLAAGAVQQGEDLYRDPQLRSRGAIVEVTHPDLGTIEYAGSPHRLSKTPGYVRRPAPRLGQYTEEVLSTWTGMSAEECKNLAAKGVI